MNIQPKPISSDDTILSLILTILICYLGLIACLGVIVFIALDQNILVVF